MAKASNIIKIYKLKKSAAVAGAVVLSTMAVDSIMSKKANKLLHSALKVLLELQQLLQQKKLLISLICL